MNVVQRVRVNLGSHSHTTDRGTVQKVIVLPRDDLQTEELVLEEVEVFKVSHHILLHILVILPLSNPSIHLRPFLKTLI